MFNKVFIEEKYINSPRVKQILSMVRHNESYSINKIEDHFGKFHKPYLQKRTELNLFLGEKKGHIVKTAPPAYGKEGVPHFYFIHAYNCIYECQYCYLQGYFKSPDIVLFLNYEEIAKEIERVIFQQNGEQVWFHAGEFSDSLAMSHLTEDLEFYFSVFAKYPNAFLELRTKSANVKKLLNLNPLENVVISYSLSPTRQSKQIDFKTPPLRTRAKAIKTLQEHGYKVGLHFDPIIHSQDLLSEYEDLFIILREENLDFTALAYLSLGVVRFGQEVYDEFKKNYPESEILKNKFIIGEDQKRRLIRPLRNQILSDIKELSKKYVAEEIIYLCME